MRIKFKLLKINTTSYGLELRVSECSYNHQIINKIILRNDYKYLSKNKENETFIIKNIQNNEIEFEPKTNELTINSSQFVISPLKTNFLFVAKQIKKINNG